METLTNQILMYRNITLLSYFLDQTIQLYYLAILLLNNLIALVIIKTSMDFCENFIENSFVKCYWI